METDNKELKEETTKKEADKKETESKEETKQPVEETAVQKKKSKKWMGIVAAVVAVILLAYGGVAIYYQSHFLNHTYINNSDCSNMTATEVAAIMDQQSQQLILRHLNPIADMHHIILGKQYPRHKAKDGIFENQHQYGSKSTQSGNQVERRLINQYGNDDNDGNTRKNHLKDLYETFHRTIL